MYKTLFAIVTATALSAGAASAVSAEPLDAATVNTIRLQFGRLMDLANKHDFKALHEMFWLQLPRLSYSASMALFAARRFYAESIAADHRDPSDIARRLKNRAQFTCLGLGW